MSDLYDFNNDPNASAGNFKTDADYYRMHKIGLAKEFYVKGTTVKEYELGWENGNPPQREKMPFIQQVSSRLKPNINSK